MTRLKNADRSETLNFKELSWQTLRVEAKAVNNDDLTPLRLITNQAKCRITVKKRISGKDDVIINTASVFILASFYQIVRFSAADLSLSWTTCSGC